jgi:hypothetical protein
MKGRFRLARGARRRTRPRPSLPSADERSPDTAGVCAGTGDRLTLWELLVCEAERYRSWGNAAGDALADHMDRVRRGFRRAGGASAADLRRHLARQGG